MYIQNKLVTYFYKLSLGIYRTLRFLGHFSGFQSHLPGVSFSTWALLSVQFVSVSLRSFFALGIKGKQAIPPAPCLKAC